MVIKDDDGITLTIRFDHVRGELVLASIDAEAKGVRTERANAAAVDPVNLNDPNGVPACDEDRPVEKLTQAEWRALGLLRLAERSAAEQPEGLQRSGFDTTVVVHVGIDTLYGPDLPDPADRSARPERDEMCELEPSGIRLRRDIARWLACDTGLLTVIEDRDGNPLHIGTRRDRHPHRVAASGDGPVPDVRMARMCRHRGATPPHPAPPRPRARRRREPRPRMPRTPRRHPPRRHLDHPRSRRHDPPLASRRHRDPGPLHDGSAADRRRPRRTREAHQAAPRPRRRPPTRRVANPDGTATPSTSATASQPSKPAVTEPSDGPTPPEHPTPPPHDDTGPPAQPQLIAGSERPGPALR